MKHINLVKEMALALSKLMDQVRSMINYLLNSNKIKIIYTL